MEAMLFTETDRRAFDRWWGFAEQRNPEGVDDLVRRRCAELERQFAVFDQDEEET